MHSAPGHPKVSGAEQGSSFTANHRPASVACAVFQNLAASLVPSTQPAVLDPSSLVRLVPSPELRFLRPGTLAPGSRSRVGQLAVRSSASASGRPVPPPLARIDSKKIFLDRQPRAGASRIFFKNSSIGWPFPVAIPEGKSDFGDVSRCRSATVPEIGRGGVDARAGLLDVGEEAVQEGFAGQRAPQTADGRDDD